MTPKAVREEPNPDAAKKAFSFADLWRGPDAGAAAAREPRVRSSFELDPPAPAVLNLPVLIGVTAAIIVLVLTLFLLPLASTGTTGS